MRILSGYYRGQKLVFPEKDVLRPTQEKVRAALFNILQQQIAGARFLDLCCGTGSIGIEALSRGAAYVHFVDVQTALVRENLLRLKPLPGPDKYTLTRSRADRFLSTNTGTFDFIFCDPPWHDHALYTQILSLISGLCLGGSLFLEHHKDYDIDQALAAPDFHNILVVSARYGYSDTYLTRLEKKHEA